MTEQTKPKCEADNCRHRLMKYCQGQGIDIGCSFSRITTNAIGIDLYSPYADMKADARNLDIFPDEHFNFVFSSHLLEEIENTEATLKEWLRILHPGGYLVLYQADKELYYPIGHPSCNKNHKHHFSWEDLWKIFEKIGNVELIHHAQYGQEPYGEWSFELVIQKTGIKKEKITNLVIDQKNIIRIIVPCFNSNKYIIECINSIKKQTIKKWVCYIINDISTDKTAEFIKAGINKDERFIVINNKEKMYVPGNYWQILNREEIDPHDICINVDGDDWLSDEKVFERILKAYIDENVWLTFGQFQEYKNGLLRMGWAKPPNWNTLRKTFDWRATHLRTFKVWLFRKIKKEDLISSTGTFFESAGDLSFMIPMLEMAGPKHCKFLKDINYIYNTETPLNDHKQKANIQKKCATEIFNKPPYKRLMLKEIPE